MVLALFQSLALGVVVVVFLNTGIRTPLDTLSSIFLAESPQKSVDFTVDPVCKVISQSISAASAVHWPESPEYDTDIHHWASSSMKQSKCSVVPGTTRDLGILLQLLGWTNTPFAISGGGHALNPGFSSTEGVHISMSRFNSMEHNEQEETIEIGAGLRWNDVYGFLNPKGYSAVGGRVNDVGVAGFILGGGLSWITNEHGLTIDTLVSCEIVLPNGTVTVASADINPDLFFGLKGGFNNFGVVTKFTLRVFPQSDIWGGAVIVPESEIEHANSAIANFANNVRDVKATMNVIYEYAEGSMNAIVILFYNAPEPPVGMFDEVFAINNTVSQASTMSFTTLLNAGQPRNTPRRIQGVAPIQRWTASILQKITNETKFWGSYLEQNHSGHFFDYVVEIFHPDYFSHGLPSAWPADRSNVHYPLNVAFAWYEERSDQVVYDALRQTIHQIRTDAEAEGQSLAHASLYPNLPIAGTSLEDMYGNNLQRLREIRTIYDPDRVMDLTGGWRF